MELRMSFTGREPSPRCEALNSIPKPQGDKKEMNYTFFGNTQSSIFNQKKLL